MQQHLRRFAKRVVPSWRWPRLRISENRGNQGATVLQDDRLLDRHVLLREGHSVVHRNRHYDAFEQELGSRLLLPVVRHRPGAAGMSLPSRVASALERSS
jgi:hypothetical protein